MLPGSHALGETGHEAREIPQMHEHPPTDVDAAPSLSKNCICPR